MDEKADRITHGRRLGVFDGSGGFRGNQSGTEIQAEDSCKIASRQNQDQAETRSQNRSEEQILKTAAAFQKHYW
jgi:hypothetical protein